MDKYIGWYRRIRRSPLEYPRGQMAYATRNEKLNYTPLYFVRRNGGVPAIGMMEGLQLIAGVFDVEAIKRIAPNAKHELFTEQMAYGPRVVDQLPSVLGELTKDPETRRAVLMIARPEDKLDERPCTLSIQFHAQRDAVKHEWVVSSTAFMRSSDAIWGMPYDIIQFGMLTYVMADMFGHVVKSEPVQLGSCSVMVGNAHMYVETDPARNGRAWFKTVGPMLMPTHGTLGKWREWALKSIKQTKVAGDLYRQFSVVEDLL